MSSGTVGAKIIAVQDRQYFNCIIREIVCHHSDDKKALLYSLKKVKNELDRRNSERLQLSKVAPNGAYVCSIQKTAYPQYYFISNYSGEEITLECKREVNSCTDRNHGYFVASYDDVDSRELKSNKYPVERSKLKLRYYDLFYRAGDYAKSTATHIMNHFKENPSAVAVAVIPTSTGVAYGAGSIMDFLFALRFIHLPLIKEDDEKYYCHAILYYTECPYGGYVSPINIQIYPDIEFCVEFGLKRGKVYQGSRKEKDSTESSASFKFSIKYNSVEKEVSFENATEEEIGMRSKEKEGTRFYKVIDVIRKCFKKMHQFTKNLREDIEDSFGKNNAITKSAKALQGGAYGIASRNLSWLEGSLELEPSLSLTWRYYVPDDLSLVRRYFELEFGISGSGSLTIDLIELTRVMLRKAKTVSTAATVVVSVGSGGLAALPAILVKALVDGLITMVTNWLKKPFKADLILSCSAELAPIKFNNLENENFEASLKIEPEAKLSLSMEAKVAYSISIFVSAEIEVEAKAYAKASISFPVEFLLKSTKEHLTLDFKAEISPFKVEIGYGASASWNVFKKVTKIFEGKKKTKKATNTKKFEASDSHSWEFGGCKMEPVQWVFFEDEKKEE